MGGREKFILHHFPTQFRNITANILFQIVGAKTSSWRFRVLDTPDKLIHCSNRQMAHTLVLVFVVFLQILHKTAH